MRASSALGAIVGVALGLVAGAGCKGEVAGGRADGAAVYAEACSRCHGRAGVPSREMALQLRVPDLTRAELHTRMSDADLRNQIVRGSPSRGMPGFAGTLTEAQINALVAYLRTLRK